MTSLARRFSATVYFEMFSWLAGVSRRRASLGVNFFPKFAGRENRPNALAFFAFDRRAAALVDVQGRRARQQ